MDLKLRIIEPPVFVAAMALKPSRNYFQDPRIVKPAVEALCQHSKSHVKLYQALLLPCPVKDPLEKPLKDPKKGSLKGTLKGPLKGDGGRSDCRQLHLLSSRMCSPRRDQPGTFSV